MASIVPAILTNDPADYTAKVTTYTKFARRLQIDISDGSFTPQTTIGLDSITPIANISLDLHMMVGRPSEHLPKIIAIKPALVILHAEAGENLLDVFKELQHNDIKVGVALLKPTFPGRIRPYIDAADHALIFAGALGQQGGQADLLQIEKVPLIRSIKKNIEIGWDGGANMQNVRALGHADIDIINAGSAIATAEDPAAAYNALVKESEARGVKL